MKILIISQYYFPEQFMITKIAEALNDCGNDMTVLTGIPNYPMGKIIGNYKNKFSSEIINNVQVIRVPMILRGKGMKMILNYFSYAFLASIRALFLKERYDKIYVFEVSPITQVLPALIYKKLKNKSCQIIVNCQDIWPEVLKSSGFQEESFIYKMGFKISHYLYHKANKILISSALFKNYLMDEFGIHEHKIQYLPNYADEWVLNISNKQIDDKVHFLFAGNIGKAQNLDIIIHAVSKSHYQERLIIDFVGDGSEIEHLKVLTNTLSLDKVIRFHGRKNIEDLKYYYEIADAYLLTLVCDNKICYTVPSKVQGYMGAGKPIIASILGGAKDLIEQAKCGIVCKYNDIDSLSQTIDDFVVNKDNYINLGVNGRQYFKMNFQFKEYINNLIRNLEELK